MKKYNLSKIMKKAWETFRKFKSFLPPLPFSECLKRAWEEAKKAAEEVKEITLSTVKMAAHSLIEGTLYTQVTFSAWENYGKSRVYIKAIKYTLAGNKREASLGYWDNNTNEYITQKGDFNVFTDKAVFN